VRFQRWNVDHPPAADEIEEGSYDVIIATNVLHATGDIRRTLRNVKAALRPGGVLLLNETIFKTLFGTLTFGLLDGWWAFDDGHLRISGSPLLAPGQWACLLEEEGFRETRFLTEPLEAAAQLVIAAESDGWIHRGIEPAIARALLPAPRSRKVAVTAAPEDHLDHVQAIVVNAVASSLSIELGRIDQRVPFSDYGVDSIVGTQLVALIRKDLGIDINASVLYEHTSVERLVRHLRGVIPGRTAIGPVAAIVKDLDAAPFDALEAAFLSGELSPDDVLELLENTPSGGGVGQ
jgi:acyl carrier protein